jgi:hypothetical protein
MTCSVCLPTDMLIWRGVQMAADEKAAADAQALEAAELEAQQQAAAHVAIQAEEELAVSDYTATLREHMLREVMPSLCKILVGTVQQRPADAVGYVAQKLLEEADELDKQHEDPYDAPVYGEKAAMAAGKRERDAARAVAADAAAEAEAAARQALDDELREMLLHSMQKHESMMRS